MAEWNAALTDWLKPFVEKLGHKKRRQMCPLYVTGLIGPGDRKSIEPMAARFAPERYDRLHHPRILNIRTERATGTKKSLRAATGQRQTSRDKVPPLSPVISHCVRGFFFAVHCLGSDRNAAKFS